jgi:septum formation protein
MPSDLPDPVVPAGAKRLVLASRSPRRQEALTALGVPFETFVSDVELRLGTQADPTDPLPIAVAKALDGAAHDPDAVVLAGDTIVVVDDRALGKPAHPADAADMLRQLKGRRHAVRTAIATATATTREVMAAEVASPVRMRRYPDDEIVRYVDTGEPLDCAGAYDVHRLGGALVEEVEGCLSAVVGLPVVASARALVAAGIGVPQDPVAICTRLYGRPCLAGRPALESRCLPGGAPTSGRFPE